MPQSLSSILIHLVFSTKHREPIIKPDIEPELYPYLSTVFRECQSPALLINGTADHLHTLFSMHRTQSVSAVVEEVKKRSSKWIKTKDSAFKNFAWQAGYGAFSIGQSNVAVVKKYIANQKAKHAEKTFKNEFRGLLRKYEIEYDEKYVWD